MPPYDREGRILPEYRDGEMISIKIDKIEKGGFYDKLGMADGTVITEVNGIVIDSPAATKDILAELTKGGTLSLQDLEGNTRELDPASFGMPVGSE